MKTKILVADDDKRLLKMIKSVFETAGYTVFTTDDGEKALNLILQKNPDLIILDIRIPTIDGLEICYKLRHEINSDIPILFLTSTEEISVKLHSFEVGADDYIVKPFNMYELLARVRVFLRRANQYIKNSNLNASNILSTSQHPPEIIQFEDLIIDFSKQIITKNGININLTPKEGELLKLLIKEKGRICSRFYLLQEIWGCDYNIETKTIDTHIQRLRRKIETDPDNPSHIITVYGKGFRFQ